MRKDNLALLFPDIKPASFDQNVKNWLKAGKLIKLKRGFYVPEEYWQNCANKDEYLNYLASLLDQPSYVSKETVLARYGVLSEAVFGVASITGRATKNYSSKIANFSYAKIKRQLFCGFSRAQFEGKNYDIASKSKALFDYLYFAKRTIKHANAKTVAELRLNLEGFSSADWREFEDYLAIARSEKMRRIYQALRSKHAF
ncbi:hypothetical protein A2548_03625 [candidate division WOR-1 bacterium RIFOXYD2_FULL_41_8]|uniref:AbiEi antitoxin C-terminal domain-containing protein n=1 Tax=candidate division WOR-1 bacterium RIFOXYC2_FULL_41_25 TaxID=1802586 RepID=A0A1F4TR26_UNCSA|nr:MAG: hypothetical protein A2462_06150 [candidate division WOR-1 bacterium RIFOXYC2_FULL_41_25]OGC42205.1 MAG: hypothetical protein A2548_03625 [candidate division WOR-1 bacterium RIFOXYD2_FULL_41_8]